MSGLPISSDGASSPFTSTPELDTHVKSKKTSTNDHVHAKQTGTKLMAVDGEANSASESAAQPDAPSALPLSQARQSGPASPEVSSTHPTSPHQMPVSPTGDPKPDSTASDDQVDALDSLARRLSFGTLSPVVSSHAEPTENSVTCCMNDARFLAENQQLLAQFSSLYTACIEGELSLLCAIFVSLPQSRLLIWVYRLLKIQPFEMWQQVEYLFVAWV